jgi:hypothetical protein
MSKLSRFKAKTVGFIFEEEKGGVDLLFVVVVVALPFPDHPTCGTLKCGFSRRDPRLLVTRVPMWFISRGRFLKKTLFRNLLSPT